MRKIFTLILALVATLSTLRAVDYSGTCGDNITWNLTSGVLTISGSGDMNDFTYNRPPWYSFRSSIIEVSIDNDITSIGRYAFADCTGLTSVTIPNSVTSIGGYAFYGCTGLTSLEFPVNLTSIGSFACRGCSNLTRVVWNAKHCANFGNVASNETIIGPFNAVRPFQPDINFRTPISTFILGDEVEYIPSRLCEGMEITSIEIPNSVTSIGNYAFYECSKLESVNIPHGVTSIEKGTFYDCYELTNIDIPSSITHIGDIAFSGCTKLTSIEIPNSVTSIGKNAFSRCSKLESVNIPHGVTSIEYQAFSQCIALTSVTIPNSVTSIGYQAFFGCSGLTSIEIPNSVTSIEYQAFGQCKALTSVTIPNSVTSIGDQAFSQCRALTSVTFEASTPPVFGNSLFPKISMSIIVPCGSIDAYSQALPDYATYLTNPSLSYSITGNILPEGSGNIITPPSLCDDTIISATPSYGYHFTKWSDGNTDNPRRINLTQDTTFTAEFAQNEYTIATMSADEERGTTTGGGVFLYLDQTEISATPNYGYHFAKWADGNTDNPRVVTITKDETYEAVFAKNIYAISLNSDQVLGTVSGPANAEYLDDVTITAIPNYGYHFTKWSDGVTGNPRAFIVMQDTVFTAEFAPNTYTLNASCDKEHGAIEGQSGTFEYLSEHLLTANANYGYTFAQWSDGVTDNPRTLILSQDTTITALYDINYYRITFFNWNGDSITEQSIAYNHAAEVPELPTRDGYIFKGWTTDIEHIIARTFAIALYDKVGVNISYLADDGEEIFSEHADIHFPDAPIRTGKTFAGWLTESADNTNGIIFRALYTIDDPNENDNVTVTPSSHTADVNFPFVTGAVTYMLVIRQLNGNIICKIMFDSNGRLLGIAFAPGRNRSQQAQTVGFQFTVEGLDPSTTYVYEFVAHDGDDAVIETLSGSFTTTAEVPTDVQSPVTDNRSPLTVTKIVQDNHVYILRGNQIHTVTGQQVK